MTSDLRDVLSDFVAAEDRASTAAAPDPELEVRMLARRIARRRAARAGAVSVTSAAAVVGLAAGVAALTDREEPRPPAHTSPVPTPTPTPTPSPTSTSEPTTPAVTTPPITEHPLLPTGVRAADAAVLAASDTSWTFVQYTVPQDVHTGALLYLVDPDGVLHELVGGAVVGDVVDWLPGTSLVLTHELESSTTRVVDAATGEVLGAFETGQRWYFPKLALVGPDRLVATRVDTERADYVEELVVVTFGGEVLEVTDGPTLYAPWLVSPGRDLVLDRQRNRVLSTADLTPVPLPALDDGTDPASCDLLNWLGTSELVAACGSTHWRLDLAGASSSFPVPAGLELDNVVRTYFAVGDDIYTSGIVEQPSGEYTSVLWQVRDGALVEVPTPPVQTFAGRAGDRFVVMTTDGDLVAVDPVDQQHRTLLDRPDDDAWWVTAFPGDPWMVGAG